MFQCYKHVYFNKAVYRDRLTFEATLRWPLQELQLWTATEVDVSFSGICLFLITVEKSICALLQVAETFPSAYQPRGLRSSLSCHQRKQELRLPAAVIRNNTINSLILLIMELKTCEDTAVQPQVYISGLLVRSR